MPKAKTPSLLDEARAIPASRSKLRWDERLTPEQSKELKELVAAKRAGDVPASYLALGQLLVKRFGIKTANYKQIAQDVSHMVRGDA